MQVLLLAQAVQKRSLLLQEGLPRREEHRAAYVQPDPLPVVHPVGADGRADAVSDALRSRPAGFGGVRGGGGSTLSRLAVFVVVIIIVAVVLGAEAC